MTQPSLNTLIKKSKKDHNFITAENLFFNPKTQMDNSALHLFLREKEESGITFFDKPQKITQYYDQFDNNLLHMAEASNNKKLAYWLITYAPELMYEKNRFGHYPAHFAAANYLGLQKYPTEFLNCKTVFNDNILHIAAVYGSLSNVQLILNHTDYINQSNDFGGPALHCSVIIYSQNFHMRREQIKITQLLLSQVDERLRKKQLQHKSAFGLCPNDYFEKLWKPAERTLLQDFL